MTAPVCCVCGKPPLAEADDPRGATELRPYGPGGAPICFTCATKSDRVGETNRRYFSLLDAAEDASVADGGDVAHVVLTPDGPKPLKTGRS